MSNLVGGLKAPEPVNDEVRSIALSVKPEVEGKAGRKFDTYNPVEYSSQVVAGTNFFIKIDVGDSHVHVRVFRDLPHNESKLSVHSVQTDKKSTDPLTYF